MEQTRVSKKPKIKESSAICTKCGHNHDVAIVKAKYEAREQSFTSFFCHACNAYNRIRYTKKGLVRLSPPMPKVITRPIIKADRMECAYCDHPLEREDFEFLLKKTNARRTTCRNCYGALTVRRTALGFYTTNKSNYSRILDSIEKGINRKEFDPVEKKFKFLKDRYPLKKKQ